MAVMPSSSSASTRRSRVAASAPTATPRRSYEDGCAAAHALDLIGERWALLVVRELVFGPKRFTDLRAGLPGVSPNVLTQRLDDLEAAAVLRRRKLAPPAAAWVYELTPWGTGLAPILLDLGRWAARSPMLPAGRPINADSLVMSFQAMFDPTIDPALRLHAELLLGEHRYQVWVEGGHLQTARGEPAEPPEVVLEADSNALAAVVYGGRKLADALRAGELTVRGDKALIKRFVALFPLPETAPGPG